MVSICYPNSHVQAFDSIKAMLGQAPIRGLLRKQKEKI